MRHSTEQSLPKHPIEQSDLAARNVYKHPKQAAWHCYGVYKGSIEYYQRIGSYAHNEDLATFTALRAVWRALLAPLIHNAELTHYQAITTARQEGRSILPPADANLDEIRSEIEGFDGYTPAQQAFLEASGYHARRNALQFEAAIKQPGHKYHPIWKTYRTLYPMYEDAASRQPQIGTFRDFGGDAERHFRAIAITSNATALRSIAPAIVHMRHWPGDSATSEEALLSRADQIGWPQSVSARFLERHFSYTDEPQHTSRCPYATDENQLATGSIYRIASLRNGPLDLHLWCPANVELANPAQPDKVESAATMRIKTDIMIASETLLAA